MRQKPSLAHDVFGTTGCRCERPLSHQSHNGADSPTVAPVMDYCASTVPPVMEVSYWLTVGLYWMRDFCQMQFMPMMYFIEEVQGCSLPHWIPLQASYSRPPAFLLVMYFLLYRHRNLCYKGTVYVSCGVISIHDCQDIHLTSLSDIM